MAHSFFIASSNANISLYALRKTKFDFRCLSLKTRELGLLLAAINLLQDCNLLTSLFFVIVLFLDEDNFLATVFGFWYTITAVPLITTFLVKEETQTHSTLTIGGLQAREARPT